MTEVFSIDSTSDIFPVEDRALEGFDGLIELPAGADKILQCLEYDKTVGRRKAVDQDNSNMGSAQISRSNSLCPDDLGHFSLIAPGRDEFVSGGHVNAVHVWVSDEFRGGIRVSRRKDRGSHRQVKQTLSVVRRTQQ